MIIETIKNDPDENIKLTALRTLDVFSEAIVVEKLKELKEHPSVNSNPLIMEFINKKLRINDSEDLDLKPKQTMPNGIKYALAFGFIFLFTIIIFGLIHFNNIKMELDSRISNASDNNLEQKSISEKIKIDNRINENSIKEEYESGDEVNDSDNNIESTGELKDLLKDTDIIKLATIDNQSVDQENKNTEENINKKEDSKGITQIGYK